MLCVCYAAIELTRYDSLCARNVIEIFLMVSYVYWTVHHLDS